jgi:L-aspartate oxidase
VKRLDFDFLVIGGGLAGLYSADYGASFGDVALLTKSTLKISNSSWAQGGIAAAIGKDDDTQLHFDDTIKAGRGLCDEEAVKVLVEEGRDRIIELIESGFSFDMEENTVTLGLEGGHSRRRILHAGGDSTGREIVNYFTDIVKANDKIKIFENTFVYKLLILNGKCLGVYSYNDLTKENILFTSSNTILATGGASGVFSRTTNPETSTGDGITLAYDAGAGISDMEFIQFHPTSFYQSSGETFLISEALRGEGAYVVNSKGERFLNNYDPKGELAPRDIVSSAIYSEMKSNGSTNVYMTLNHLDHQKIKSRFSHIYNEALKYGIDITNDLVPIAPASHYMIGGIRTDLNGETNIKGLFACGEAASTGVHGANRLASNSLLECLVFGKRVIDKAKNELKKNSHNNYMDSQFTTNEENKEKYISLRKRLSKIMMDKVGIIRSKESLNDALKEIKSIYPQVDNYKLEYFDNKLFNEIRVCELIVKSALVREESRGAHKRSDFPDENPSMIKRIVHYKEKEISLEQVEKKQQ